MSRFTIVVAKRDIEPHTARYDDFVKALGDALVALGHEVVGLDNPGRLIMFNTTNMFDPTGQLPADAIMFNTEQLAAVATPKFIFPSYNENKKRVIWDYSDANAKVFRELGCERVVHCPIGYIPSMTTIEPACEDVDVLFYGSLPARRAEILTALADAGLAVKHLYGVFGKERDEWIARSKIVLNLHYGYDYGAVFEIVRVSHLLANKKCVVSEAGGVDDELEALASQSCCYIKRDQIVDVCKSLCRDNSRRQFYAERGFQAFAKIALIANVRHALELS